MALATRCPNCDAMFRVVSDQLKLRGGLVRCGACRHVFDAIGSLSYIEDAALTTGSAAAPELAPAPAGNAAAPAAARGAARKQEEATEAPPQAGTIAAAPPAAATDPLAVPTLLAPGAAAPRGGSAPDALDALTAAAADRARGRRDAPPQPSTRPPAADADEGAEAAVDAAFLRRRRRPRWAGALLAAGSALLALLLVAQLSVLYRTELVTRWPALRPTLAELCKLAGCTLGWPTRAELIAVVGSELQALPGTDVLELTAVLRNRASFRVALPALELTLTDAANRTLARKVFLPADYLAAAGEPASRLADGLGAGSDYAAQLTFEARGLAAAGFVVYPFYP